MRTVVHLSDLHFGRVDPRIVPPLVDVIGADIPGDEVAAILGRLGCEVAAQPGAYSVTVPTFRPDLEREIDLVEEIGADIDRITTLFEADIQRFHEACF